METRYVAYGLALRSSLGLPGMVPAGTEGLLPLDLELATPTRLASKWSGPAGAPVWSGRLGDGSELTVQHGTAGDVLLTHGEHARHHLDARRRSLAVAPLRRGSDWQRALLTKVLPIVSLMRGYEALHASAVDSPWGAVAIVAPTGMGKTTLALELMRRGWPLLSDDVLVMTATPEGVWAYPGTPHMNIAPNPSSGGCADDIGRTLAMLADERWVAVHDVVPEPRPVHAICLLERECGSPLDIQVLPSSPLPLSPYMLGLPGDAQRDRARFELYADLAAQARLLRITRDATTPPAQLADLLEQACADRPAALALGASR